MKKLTIFLAALLVIFSVTSVSWTYAYWNSMSQLNATTRVSIGSWDFGGYPIWSPNVVYQIGEIVSHNGQLWIKIKNAGNNIEPSTKPPGRNFWQPYN